jgi:hypothetical protein
MLEDYSLSEARSVVCDPSKIPGFEGYMPNVLKQLEKCHRVTITNAALHAIDKSALYVDDYDLESEIKTSNVPIDLLLKIKLTLHQLLGIFIGQYVPESYLNAICELIAWHRGLTHDGDGPGYLDETATPYACRICVSHVSPGKGIACVFHWTNDLLGAPIPLREWMF